MFLSVTALFERLLVTWVLYSKSESGPPGQYTQMLPVVAMCGQRCGLDMTATTAMPDAVRTGFARSLPRAHAVTRRKTHFVSPRAARRHGSCWPLTSQTAEQREDGLHVPQTAAALGHCRSGLQPSCKSHG